MILNHLVYKLGVIFASMLLHFGWLYTQSSVLFVLTGFVSLIAIREMFSLWCWVDTTLDVSQPQSSPLYLQEWIHLKASHFGGWVYILRDVDVSGLYKIGVTYKPYQRMKAFAVKLPFNTELVYVIQSNNARELERQLHQKFYQKRKRGEWFDLSEEDIQVIKLSAGRGIIK